MAVEVPQERLAGRPGPAILFRSPERPEQGVFPLDATVVREKRLDGRKDLQALGMVQVPPPGEKRPEIHAPPGGAAWAGFLPQIRIQEIGDPNPLPLQRAGLQEVVLVERPEVKVALQFARGGVAVEGEQARLGFVPAREYKQGPEEFLLAKILVAVFDAPVAKGPAVGGFVAQGGAQSAVEGQDQQALGLVGGAHPGEVF